MTARFRMVVCNDDFTDRVSDIPYLCRTEKPLAWATQESKGTRYADLLGEQWGVRQKHKDESTEGVAVGWDREQAHRLDGGGWFPIIDGKGILTRGVVFQDLLVPYKRFGRRREFMFRLASYHRPPIRYAQLWPEADKRLVEWIQASPIPLWLGVDSNEEGGPLRVERATRINGMKWHGHRIDGALSNLPIGEVDDLPFRRSDHRAIAMTMGAPR